MAFKARKDKSGSFEVHGVEVFLEKLLEKRIGDLKKLLGFSSTQAPARKAKKLTAAPKLKLVTPLKPSALDLVVDALHKHPKRAALVAAGKKPDQLLRALIPLYLQRNGADLTSGVTSKFWGLHGVKFAAPNAAKALRNHSGFSKSSKGGRAITAQGIRYVDDALKGKRAA